MTLSDLHDHQTLPQVIFFVGLFEITIICKSQLSVNDLRVRIELEF